MAAITVVMISEPETELITRSERTAKQVSVRTRRHRGEEHRNGRPCGRKLVNPPRQDPDERREKKQFQADDQTEGPRFTLDPEPRQRKPKRDQRGRKDRLAQEGDVVCSPELGPPAAHFCWAL